MHQRLFITIAGRGRKDRVLVEIPGDEPIQGWIHDLIQVVGWKELAEPPPDGYSLETEEGDALPGGQTLQEAGISNSDLLYLAAREPPDPPAGEGVADGAPRDKGSQAASAAVDDSVARFREILQSPRLTGPQGLVFLISRPLLAIGRSGKGSTPGIDLTEWDSKVISSRKHAVLEKTGEEFCLRPEKTTNGTFVNGVEAPVPTRARCRVRYSFIR
jgi:hypothetical protein